MALVAENISLYLSGFNILRNINLSISAGKVTAIVGPNGAGKSTLIKVLSGDILPTSGGVLLNDKKLDRWPLEQRAKTMSVLPQHSSLDFPFTASEVVSLGRIPHQTGVQKDNEIVKEALDLVDASYLKSRFFTQMSGGEKQRVQLARVLAQIWEKEVYGEQFLVLDEPTASLDLSHQMLTVKVVTDLAKQGVGVVMVIHDLNLAASCADHIVVFDKGIIAATGQPDQVLNQELIGKVFGINPVIISHPNTGKPLVFS
ncbi:MAG TPA: heme ABC transporter ATP-binding protein [Porticoccaceae bacterium]|jgi:iron complex transport system ATP-binding protein|nr:heme ABC transporter ATP-binding protein [Porticoccaceae bacterium]